MKARESGMPERDVWDSLFDPEMILSRLGLASETADTVEFGCGHGTFALPAARRIHGTLYGFDIDPAMIEECRRLAQQENLQNVHFEERDFIANGTGLADGTIAYAMLFNILHAETPENLLQEAGRILMPGGRLAVIHWNYDSSTPRGPSMSIRPRPDDCRRWLIEADFDTAGRIIDLPPYHYGLLAAKQESS